MRVEFIRRLQKSAIAKIAYYLLFDHDFGRIYELNLKRFVGYLVFKLAI